MSRKVFELKIGVIRKGFCESLLLSAHHDIFRRQGRMHQVPFCCTEFKARRSNSFVISQGIHCATSIRGHERMHLRVASILRIVDGQAR